jgi:hypothetical protein
MNPRVMESSVIVKSWSVLVVAGTVFLTLGCLLIWVVAQLIRKNREQILATAALVAEQELAIREPGELVLLLETPRVGIDYRNFEFDIIENVTGQRTHMKYEYMRAQGAVYGVTTMRVPLGRMTAQRAGTYLMRVTGLQASKDYSACRILLSRPYLGRMVLQIIGIVICGIGMLLSLLLGSWQVLPLQSDVPSPTPAATPAGGVPGRTIDLETWKRLQQQRPSPSQRPDQ